MFVALQAGVFLHNTSGCQTPNAKRLGVAAALLNLCRGGQIEVVVNEGICERRRIQSRTLIPSDFCNLESSFEMAP